MTIKGGKEAVEFGEITLENNVRLFKVYDCPVELINNLISYAKLYTNNQVWKVIAMGFELLMEQDDRWRIEIEKRISALEDKVFSEDKSDEPITMGNPL